MDKQKTSITQITGLRGVIAFLIAYVLHWSLLFWAVPDFNNVLLETVFGESAPLVIYSPNIFFILSGYLIHQSYNNRITINEISFVDFLVPKMKKIYPIVIVTAVITWILQNAGMYLFGFYPLHEDGGQIRNSLYSLMLSFLGLQSGYISDNDNMSVNGPAWFVAILFLCYIIYYVITYLVRHKIGQNLLYVVFIGLGISIMLDTPSFPLLYLVNGRGYFSFFAGVMIKEYVNWIEKSVWSDNLQICLKIVTYIVSLVCLCYSFYFYCIKPDESQYKALILAIMFWPSLVYIVIHGYILRWILSLKCFVYLGKMAMPMFLCNFPTDVAIRMCDIYFKWELDYSNPWLWFLHVIISLIIVFVFHLIFEVDWKKKD